MEFQEFVLAIVGIVGGTGVVGYTVAKITGLIKMGMQNRHERKMGNTQNARLQQEFQEFKKRTNRRLENLEAVIVDEDVDFDQLEEPSPDIRIEDQSERESEEQSPKSANQQQSGLDNMLN